MNPAEAARLLTGVTRLDGRVHPDNRTAQLWAEVMPYTRYDAAKAAIVEHYRTATTVVMPADILRLSRTRVDRTVVPPTPPVDPDDWARYRAWCRAWTAAIGRGATDTEAHAEACRVTRTTPRPMAGNLPGPDLTGVTRDATKE